MATKQKRHWLNSRYRWMIGAVYNPNNPEYQWAHVYDCDWTYGRGQFEDFIDFVENKLGKPTKTHKYLSRKDQTKGWTKKNLIWRSSKELSNKQIRGTRLVKYKGKTTTLALLSEEYGINYHTLRTRIRWGWTLKDALTTPPRSIK